MAFIVGCRRRVGITLFVLISFSDFMWVLNLKLVQELNVTVLLLLLLVEELGILVLVSLHDHLP